MRTNSGRGNFVFEGSECKNMVTISTPGDLQRADLDEVTLAPELVITGQSIGSMSPSSRGFDKFKFGGILGLGPVGLTKGRFLPNTNALVPTVMKNLKSQELVTEEVFSLYISPGRTGEYSMACCWLLPI